MLKSKFLNLCILGATFASISTASIMLTGKPSQAASLTYIRSFDGLVNTKRTLVANDQAGFVSSIANTVGRNTVTGPVLVGQFRENDNLLSFKENGVSFVAYGLWDLWEDMERIWHYAFFNA
jgi:hypothetical protein